jgi:hypothetical protein
MSSNKTSTPMLAKWHAMREPIIPEPKMATFLMILFFMLFIIDRKVAKVAKFSLRT